jgi:hypothetical protein
MTTQETTWEQRSGGKYIPVFITKLEGRILAIDYDKKTYRLRGESKKRAKRAVKEGIKDIFFNRYGRIWVKETDLFPIDR